MDRAKYRKTDDFMKAKNIICDFINEALNGDVNELKNKDITLLISRINESEKRNRYFGEINDPDMYIITQAVYMVVWGHIFDLKFDSLGSWGKVKYPFRGDTMNSFNSIFGKEMLIAKRYELDDVLMKNVEEYAQLYHSIGNFIVIPNKLNLNSKRANYYTIQDYFDSFLGALYQYKFPDEDTVYRCFCDELAEAFAANEIFSEISFDEYVEQFFLCDYVKDNKPQNVFDIPYELRNKEFIGRSRRSKSMFVTDREYRSLVSHYYNAAKKIIHNRAECIVKVLEAEIGNA